MEKKLNLKIRDYVVVPIDAHRTVKVESSMLKILDDIGLPKRENEYDPFSYKTLLYCRGLR